MSRFRNARNIKALISRVSGNSEVMKSAVRTQQALIYKLYFFDEIIDFEFHLSLAALLCRFYIYYKRLPFGSLLFYFINMIY